MLKTLVAVLLAGGLTAALTRPDGSAARPFFPLALHNTWTHEVKFSGGDYHYFMTETVTRDDFALAQSVSYVVEEEYEPLTDRAPRARSTVAYFRKDGFLHRYPWLDSEDGRVWDTALGAGVERLLPSPFTGAVEWQVATRTHAWPMEGGQRMRAAASARLDPTEVRVPAGRFRDCLRVETTVVNSFLDPAGEAVDFTLFYVEWYARGVGLVKATSSGGEGTPIKSVTELVSYEVHPSKR